MSEVLYKIRLTDSDEYDVDYNQEEIVEIDDKNIVKLEEVYELYDDFWRHSGDFYDTYEDYLEDWDENDIIKNHFDAFVASTDERSIDALVSLFKEVYPNEYIEVKECNEIEFEY